MCRIEDLEGQRYVARAYLDRLIDIRTLRSAGKLPVFSKNYQTLKAHWLRLGMVYGLHLVNLATRGARWPNNKAIPEVIDRAHQSPPTIVVKSVSACGRARLFLEALPGSRIVFIVRHPCAQVASVLRGIALGRFTNPSPELLGTDQALQLNLTAERFEALTPIEKPAWQWAILNQKTIDDLSGVCGVRIVRYEDLVADPASVVRELFAFAGLTWHPQTAGFILKSTTSNGIDRYYGIKKKSNAMIVKWHKQLSLTINVEFSTLPVACLSGGYLANSSKRTGLFCQAGLSTAPCTQNRQREAGAYEKERAGLRKGATVLSIKRGSGCHLHGRRSRRIALRMWHQE
jgi:hypothetical protein